MTTASIPSYKTLRAPTEGETISLQGGRLAVPDTPIIPFIEGDGTGPDIWHASRIVFDAAVERVRAALQSTHERNLTEFQQVRQSVDRLRDASAAHAGSRQRRMAWAAGAAGLVLGGLPSLAFFLHR